MVAPAAPVQLWAGGWNPVWDSLERVLTMDMAARRRHDSQAGGPRYVAKASSPAGSDGVSPTE